MQLTDVATASVREYCSHEAGNTVASIAPHGGEIEPYTATQAFRLAELLDDCSAWAYCGFHEEESAFDEFHTTSTRLNPHQFQLLPDITESDISVAISFHGFVTEEVDVYLGGRMGREYRHALAERIIETTGLAVAVAQPKDGLYRTYGGVSRRNITNKIAPQLSLQVEQVSDARSNHAERICQAVAETIENRLA